MFSHPSPPPAPLITHSFTVLSVTTVSLRVDRTVRKVQILKSFHDSESIDSDTCNTWVCRNLLVPTFFMFGTFLCLLGAAFVSALGKDLYDRIRASRCSRRCLVASNVRSNHRKLIELNDYPVIPFPSLEKHLLVALRDCEDGGVWMFGAPEGSGKSTYLNRCLELFQSESQRRHVSVHQGVNALRDRSIHLALGVPLIEPISRYIPRGTIIVIDQVDCKVEAIDDKISEYVVELATDSRNSKCYSVIICVSNPEVMIKLLRLNNMEKIKEICHPKYLQWTSLQTKQFIHEVFKSWTYDEKQQLAEACHKSNSPGVLHEAHKTFRGGQYTRAEIIKLTESWDDLKHERWESYQKLFDECSSFKPYVNPGDV